MYKLTEAEWSVLRVLWDGTRFTLGEIVDGLHPLTKWSRNTVHTYLTRMEKKGYVNIDRSIDPHVYSAAISLEECAREERKSLLNKVYKGAAGDLIAAFLKESSITSKEKEKLKKLLDDMEV